MWRYAHAGTAKGIDDRVDLVLLAKRIFNEAVSQQLHSRCDSKAGERSCADRSGLSFVDNCHAAYLMRIPDGRSFAVIEGSQRRAFDQRGVDAKTGFADGMAQPVVITDASDLNADSQV